MRRRALTPEEAALWARAVKDANAYRPAGGEELPLSSRTVPARPAQVPRRTYVKTIEPSASASDPFTSGDPKLIKKLGRGALDVEATLDLHGHTQATAFSAFKNFLYHSSVHGRKRLLVITGKGAISAPVRATRRGVLREKLKDWVREPELAPIIARVAQASPRHGGAGAYYIILKSRPRP